MLLAMLVIKGASTYNNDAKGPLEDQEANTPYWYYSRWREDRS